MAPEGVPREEHDALARARSAGTWLAGLLLLGLLVTALVGAAVELWRRLDVNELVGGSRPAGTPEIVLPSPDSASPPGALAADSFRVVLLGSRASARFYPDSAFYGRALESWRSRAASLGAEVRTVPDPDSLRALSPRAVVVAPGTLCLSVDAGLALQSHVAAGGGLVAVGAVGARDAGCGWRGWEFLESLAGAREIRELDRRSGVYLTVPDGHPLAVGLGPGTRIEMRYARQLAAAAAGPLPYWSDWALSPAAAGGSGADGGTKRDAPAGRDRARPGSGALLHRAANGGRVAWLGFHPSRSAGEDDRRQARRLARNALAWAAGIPSADLAPWPGGARAGLVLAEEVESQPENARVLAGVAEERDVPATFFVASRLVPEEGDLAARLADAGEIATQTADHRPVGGEDPAAQRLALATSRREVRQWAGVSPVGLSPPEERFDRETLQAWREVGGRYLLTTNDARRASPEVFRLREGPVVLLPRVMPDDYSLYVDRGMSRGEMLRPLVRSLEKIRKLRGLAAPSFHTQLAGLESRTLIEGLVDSARAMGGWWWATGREAADWWLAREDTRISLAREPAGGDDGGLEVRVRAPSARPLVDARIRVFPSARPAGGDGSGRWLATTDGEGLPVTSDSWSLEVALDSLAAGDSAVVRLFRGEG